MWADLAVAFGLMLVIEGVLYALAPGTMRRVIEAVTALPEQTMRFTGIAVAIAGLIIVMFARG
ncbi:DUF2065 domain-containing protein [Iodidimonas sp. SYSU 1G8]|uniref:DUF2065 domain-containing protein n=1 Tax=Iodidimonas sp. SYSU 1G8 TaxID=3133967 RepID=UPI0031FEDEBA